MAIINTGEGRAPWRLPTYTGEAEIFGTKDKGYIVIKSSGILKFPGSGTVERVQMGSGLAGAKASSSQTGELQQGGAGGPGGGMWTRTAAFKVKRNEKYQITIAGACSSTTNANTTKSFGSETTPDGRGAAGGSAAYVNANTGTYTNGGNGSNGNKTPWSSNPLIPPPGSFCAGGGGGAAWLRYGNQTYGANAGSGGSPGGGNGGHYSTTHTSGAGYDAEPNTASGGGGGGRRYGDTPIIAGVGGKGGSGLVIVRWGYV